MEKFEVYFYDGVFYTLEEIDDMNLIMCSNEDIFNIPNDNNDVRFYRNNVLYSLKDIKNLSKVVDLSFYKKDNVFIVFDNYYGFRYGDNSFITKNLSERNAYFDELENIMLRKISSLCSECLNPIQIKYNNQSKEKVMKKKLIEIIP